MASYGYMRSDEERRLLVIRWPHPVYSNCTVQVPLAFVMHDPRLKLEAKPWPELRMVLKDLVRIADK